MKLSRVLVIVAATAALVYFGLNLMLPRGGKTEAPEAAAASSEEVFAAETPAASEGGEAAAVEAPAPAATEEAASGETTEAAPASSESTETAATEAPATSFEGPAETYTSLSAEPAAAPAGPISKLPTMTDEDARRIAENIGRDEGTPVAVAAAPVAVGDSSSLSEEEARKIAENVAREVAARVAGGSEAAPAPAPEPVASAPAPTPKPAAKPKPAPKSDAVAAAPKAARSSTPVAKAKAPTNKTGNGSDVISSWWSKAGAVSSDRLALVYAGEASSEKAVVLMFNNAVDAAAAGNHIKLVDVRGATPSGSWSSGSNPRVLAFKGVVPGRYTVIVHKELADSSGKTLGEELVGPVYVH